MLVSQFQEVRRFLGRLDAGQDIAAGLRMVCRENKVASGWVQASAVLRNAVVVEPRADGKTLGEAVTLEGAVVCPSISGNVSLDGESLDVRLYAACYPPEGTGPGPRVGLVRAGEVVACEFYLTACDDAALVRQSDDPAGFAPWMQLQAAGEAPRPAHVVPRSPVEGPTPPRPASVPLHHPSPAEDDETAAELLMLEMQAGDYVDHPRFGVCRIVHSPVDEKVSIRLPTGKHVDLHLGVMRILPPKQQGGRKVFQVEMRKRG